MADAPPDLSDWFDEPMPSEAVYPGWVRRELWAAEHRIGPQLRAVEADYVRRRADQLTLAALFADVERIVEIEMRKVSHPVKRYVDVDFSQAMRQAKVSIAVPLYKHDCDACTYLGRFVDRPTGRDRPTWWDLHTCSVHTPLPRTFVGRYGDHPAHIISSGRPEAVEDLLGLVLVEAQRRWERMARRG